MGAKIGDFDVIRQLLEINKNINVDVEDFSDRTPLNLAAKSEHIE